MVFDYQIRFKMGQRTKNRFFWTKHTWFFYRFFYNGIGVHPFSPEFFLATKEIAELPPIVEKNSLNSI